MHISKLGFVGASGLMGHGMARNLLAKGPQGQTLALTVNRNRERVGDLLAAGATQAANLAALAAGAELVFICVTGSPQVEAVVEQLLAGAKRGLTIVDCSTAEPDSTNRLRARCAAQGVDFIDAPLSRTPVEAEAGRLNVMVGATPEQFARIEPVLRCFAENLFHMGPPGSGHVIKLLNNFIAQAICTATAEAFAVGQRAGVDVNKLVELVSLGPVNNGLFQAMAKTLRGEMDGLKFELDNARKDVRYYTHLAEGLACPSLVGEAVHQSLTLASALGHGKKFVPSLVEAQQQLTGARLIPGAA